MKYDPNKIKQNVNKERRLQNKLNTFYVGCDLSCSVDGDVVRVFLNGHSFEAVIAYIDFATIGECHGNYFYLTNVNWTKVW